MNEAMKKPSRRTLLAAGALIALGTTVLPQGAEATHQPADKVVAAGSKIEVMSPNAEVTLLSSTLRASSPTDLILAVSMECSIFTRLVTGPSSDGGTDTAMASGHVRAWLEIDGNVVPVNGISQTPLVPPPAGSDADKVTFCNRTYQRTVTDAEDPLDGQDVEDDFIDTKAANSFNWLRLNLGSGVHRIELKGTLSQATSGDATAHAVVGNRSLIVEPAKLANDASI